MPETLTYMVTLTRTSCAACGVVFAIPERLQRKLKESGDTFYCPNGHKLHFGSNENDRLKREVERERNSRIHAEEQQGAAERTLRATKGHLTRARQRIVNGTCPFCRRHFADLARHMDTKHRKQKKRYANPKGEHTCQPKP